MFFNRDKNIQITVLAAAGFILPDGAMEVMGSGWPQSDPETSASAGEHRESDFSSSDFSGGSLLDSSSGETGSSTAENATDLPDGAVPASVTGSIQELTMANNGIQYGDIWVKNSTEILTAIRRTNHYDQLP